MTFVLKVTGQQGEQYAQVEGLAQDDAEMVVALARSLASCWERCASCAREYRYPHLCREHMLCGLCHGGAR